jgi:hypothetical protein
VSGRNLYFGRTNDGSGQGNNLFRFNLRSRKLFAARGTSRALSLTWRGDRFLMSRATATDATELLVGDPIRFTRATRADQRRTRP